MKFRGSVVAFVVSLVFAAMSTASSLGLEIGTADTPAADSKKEDSQGEEKWIQLFNGKDLTGWTAKITGYELGDNYADTFRVEDGVLKVVYEKDKYKSFDGRFGHLFYEKPFSNYILRAEYRFVGEQCAGGPDWAWRNSGLMLHGEDPKNMTKDQKFPASIEVQLLGGKKAGDRPTANLCTPDTDVVKDGRLLKTHCINSDSETYRDDQWVSVEIEVRGNKSFIHRVNGKKVLEYTKPQLDDGTLLSEGTISVQSESHGIEFRKIELRELDD